MGAYEVFLIIFGSLVLGVGGVLMVLFGAWDLLSSLRMRARATGTVVKQIDLEGDLKGERLLEIAFRTQQGTPQRFVGCPFTGRHGPQVGELVAVRYEANDAGRARIATLGGVFASLCILLFGVATVVVYVLALTHMT